MVALVGQMGPRKLLTTSEIFIISYRGKGLPVTSEIRFLMACKSNRLQQYKSTGASIPPETMMHFPPVSDFPPVFEIFLDSLENF